MFMVGIRVSDAENLRECLLLRSIGFEGFLNRLHQDQVPLQ